MFLNEQEILKKEILFGNSRVSTLKGLEIDGRSSDIRNANENYKHLVM